MSLIDRFLGFFVFLFWFGLRGGRFRDRVSLCSNTNCPRTSSIDQADLELTEIHLLLLGLKVYTTTTSPQRVVLKYLKFVDKIVWRFSKSFPYSAGMQGLVHARHMLYH